MNESTFYQRLRKRFVNKKYKTLFGRKYETDRRKILEPKAKIKRQKGCETDAKK